MKLIFAIVNRDDAREVIRSLTRKGFSATRLSTTGGFLLARNVTILVGVDAEKVQEVISVIREHSHARKQMTSFTPERGHDSCLSTPIEVTVGGATIFVMDIERFERV